MTDEKPVSKRIYRTSQNKTKQKSKIKKPFFKTTKTKKPTTQKAKMTSNPIKKWTKNLNRNFTKEKIHMVKNNTKPLILLLIKETKIN